jgi:hypothetical protein
VAALGRYWLEQVKAISRFEGKHPGSCHRIRYEDLVSEPEPVIQSMFDFLGVQRVGGISQACFGIEHAANGPGDSKIWFTDRIGTSSVGGGIRVPAHRLPDELRKEISHVLRELGYEPLGRQRHEASERQDNGVSRRQDNGVSGRQDNGVSGRPHAGADSAGESRVGHASEKASALGEASAEIWSRLTDASPETRSFIMDRWPVLDGTPMRIVVRSGDSRGTEFSWVFGAENLAFEAQDEAAADGSCASIAGDAGAWLGVLGGTANMAAEIMAGRLRFHTDGEPDWSRSASVHATAMLLGLTPTPVRSSTRQSPDTGARGSA